MHAEGLYSRTSAFKEYWNNGAWITIENTVQDIYATHGMGPACQH
jgi:hypothetical protein